MLAARTARRYRDMAAAGAGLVEPPHGCLAQGAAGVAYFLYRHASFGGGDASLAAAEWWAAWAERDRRQPGAFAAAAGPLPAVPATSLPYHEPGVWWVRALVASARGDGPQVQEAVGRFVDAAVTTTADWDVLFGSAGLLLGCAQLIERMGDVAPIGPVVTLGASLAGSLADLAKRDGARPGETTIGYLGPAHGWAGVAHALLRWSEATSAPPPAAALTLLDRLVQLRRPSGRWPVRAGSREVRRGWCHGSAGWTQLWTLAWRLTGDERLLEFAERCAADAVADEDEEPGLCCGRAGEGYAALALYRATGEDRWLVAAQRAAATAASITGDNVRHQLFYGELGVALLAAELEDPLRATMPLCQALG
jgi:serine/threonine-protein kinase